MAVFRTVITYVASTSAASAAAAGTTNAAALTSAMNNVLAAPPTGYITGSLTVQASSFFFDGTYYNAVTSFVYTTQAAT